MTEPLVIARGTVTHCVIVVVELLEGEHRGRGEARPTGRYGETLEGVLAQVHDILSELHDGVEWDVLHDRIPAGAARNAVDCAVWDLRAKRLGRPVWELLQMPPPRPIPTMFTIGIAAPDEMAAAARDSGPYNIIKLKLGSPGDVERVRAVRAAVPDKRLVVDVNEGWSIADLEANLPPLLEARVELIEQPLPASDDAALAGLYRLIPIAADESIHATPDLDRVSRLYDLINIKLDKTGGLTEAVRLLRAANRRGLDAMVGCMPGTSLAMAPAVLLAQSCRFADLDAPVHNVQDRECGLEYKKGRVHPPTSALWG